MPTWLKNFGAIVLKGIEIAIGVAPLVGIADPKVANTANTIASDLQQIFGTIQQVEVVGQSANLTGAQKLQAATPIVKQQVMALLQSWGYSVSDQNKFAGAIQGLTSVSADILNSIQEIKSA